MRTLSDRLTSDLSMFNKPHWQILADLEEKNAELERLNRLFVGRELRMHELKVRVAELEEIMSRESRHEA